MYAIFRTLGTLKSDAQILTYKAPVAHVPSAL